MSRVLFVDDDLRRLVEFRTAFGHSGVEVDLAHGLVTGFIMLNRNNYDFIFLDEDISTHRVTEDLWGAEYLEQKAKNLNNEITTVEFVSGPHYNRRVSPDFILMKPMIYRANEIGSILEGTK